MQKNIGAKRMRNEVSGAGHIGPLILQDLAPRVE